MSIDIDPVDVLSRRIHDDWRNAPRFESGRADDALETAILLLGALGETLLASTLIGIAALHREGKGREAFLAVSDAVGSALPIE